MSIHAISRSAPFADKLRWLAGRIGLTFGLALGLIAAGISPAAAKSERAERLVERATDTAAYFSTDSAFQPLWDLANDAKAMVIIPRSIRAGFIFGGAAGDGLMIARRSDGSWSQPTFLTIGAASFGLQAGGEASEIILLVMTNRGMEQLLSTSAKLGADASIAAGPIGAGAKAQTTDILAFSRSRGLYGGLSLEGAILKTRRDLNRAYYNTDASPAEIVYKGDAYNPGATSLLNSVWRLANKDEPISLAPAVAPSQSPYGAPASPGTPSRRNTQNDPSRDDRKTTYEDDEVWGAPIGKPD